MANQLSTLTLALKCETADFTTWTLKLMNYESQEYFVSF